MSKRKVYLNIFMRNITILNMHVNRSSIIIINDIDDLNLSLIQIKTFGNSVYKVYKDVDYLYMTISFTNNYRRFEIYE